MSKIKVGNVRTLEWHGVEEGSIYMRHDGVPLLVVFIESTRKVNSMKDTVHIVTFEKGTYAEYWLEYLYHLNPQRAIVMDDGNTWPVNVL